MDEVHVKFFNHKEEGYNINFNVITFQKIFESNTSNTKFTKPITKDNSTSQINWVFDIKDQHLHLGQHLLDEDGNPMDKSHEE